MQIILLIKFCLIFRFYWLLNIVPHKCRSRNECCQIPLLRLFMNVYIRWEWSGQFFIWCIHQQSTTVSVIVPLSFISSAATAWIRISWLCVRVYYIVQLNVCDGYELYSKVLGGEDLFVVGHAPARIHQSAVFSRSTGRHVPGSCSDLPKCPIADFEGLLKTRWPRV